MIVHIIDLTWLGNNTVSNISFPFQIFFFTPFIYEAMYSTGYFVFIWCIITKTNICLSQYCSYWGRGHRFYSKICLYNDGSYDIDRSVRIMTVQRLYSQCYPSYNIGKVSFGCVLYKWIGAHVDCRGLVTETILFILPAVFFFSIKNFVTR